MSLNLGIIASSRGIVAPPSALLLDTYTGAAAGYSLRKLRTAYTGAAIRVRRSSDNTETDIGFVSNTLDTTTLLTFCGIGDGFVSTWYDQSGNGKNATQTTTANQPQIVISGSVITINNKPALQVDSTDSLQLSTIIVTLRTTFCVFKRTALNSNFFPYGGGTSAYIFNNRYYFETSRKYIESAIDNTFEQILLSGYNSNDTTLFQYKNNNLLTSTTVDLTRAASTSTLFTYNGSLFSSGTSQEIIIYNSNNSSNLSGINSNINSYYSIY